jgi:hypothetical protein
VRVDVVTIDEWPEVVYLLAPELFFVREVCT